MLPLKPYKYLQIIQIACSDLILIAALLLLYCNMSEIRSTEGPSPRAQQGEMRNNCFLTGGERGTGCSRCSDMMCSQDVRTEVCRAGGRREEGGISNNHQTGGHHYTILHSLSRAGWGSRGNCQDTSHLSASPSGQSVLMAPAYPGCKYFS